MSETLTPVFRLEYFIVAAANGTPCDLEPIFNEEKYLHAIAGASVDLPMPVGRTQEYLAKLAGMDVEIPDHPIFRTEYYLAHMIDSTVECPAPIFREEMFYNEWASNEYVTVTGNPVSFTAIAAPLKQLSVAFSPVQSGTGDPSPENVRPISGWDGVEIYLQSAYDPTAQPSISISFGSTVYSGTLDLLTGVVTVTHQKITLDETGTYYTYSSGGVNSFRTSSNQFANSNNVMCNLMPPTNSFTTAGIRITQNNHIVYFVDAPTLFDIGTEVADWKAKLKELREAGTPLEFIAELITPITIQLTPQEVSSLLGKNNMWSDANGDLTVEYAVDPATTPIVGKGKVGQAIIGG